jgi:hypothetical protein
MNTLTSKLIPAGRRGFSHNLKQKMEHVIA